MDPPGAVQRNGQAKVAYLGNAISGQPHVARLQVPLDDATAVGELQTPAGLFGNRDGLIQGKPVFGGVLNQTFHVAAAHELGNDVGLVLA